MICVSVFADDAGGAGVSAEGEGSANAGDSGSSAQGASTDGGSGAEASTGGESSGSSESSGQPAEPSSAGSETGTGGETANSGKNDSSLGSSSGNPGTDRGSGSDHETSTGQSSDKEKDSDHGGGFGNGSANSHTGNEGVNAGTKESTDSSNSATVEHSDFADESSSVPATMEVTGSEIEIDADADEGSIARLTPGDQTGVDPPDDDLIEDTSEYTDETVTSIGYPEVPEDSNSEGPPDVTGSGIAGPPTYGGGGSTNPSPAGDTDADNSGRRVGLSTSEPEPSLVAPDLDTSAVDESSNVEPVLSELSGLDIPVQRRDVSRGDVRTGRGIDAYDSTPTDSGLSGRPARPGSKTDQDEALAAVENGAILPLREALKQVAEAVSGKVIDVKMNQTAEGSVYQVKVRTPDGEIRNIVVDAKTGKILESLNY